MKLRPIDGERVAEWADESTTRRAFLRRSGAVAAGGAVAATTRGWLAPLAHAASAPGADASRLSAVTVDSAAIAENVVTFGIPAVLQSRYLEISKEKGIRLNQFSVNLQLSTPATTALGPNDDTLYGLTWLDLTAGPQVIEVPATPDRYFSIQLIDMWSNPFAYIGTRATGSKAGSFAITPPGWKGTLPTGVKRIPATTKRLLAFVRTLVKDSADLKAAQKIHTSYTTGALSSYPRTRVKPRIAEQAINVFAPLDLSSAGLRLFKEINTLLVEYPPLSADAKDTTTFPKVGVGVKHYATPSSQLASVLRAAIGASLEAIEGEQAKLSTEVNGWGVDYHVDNITHNPLKRAALTIDGPGTQVHQEALYFTARQLNGTPLTGANQYTLTFPVGQRPPIGAFWSLILYDATTFRFVANPINRYEVASHDPGLTYETDGALTIAIQNTKPTAAQDNWLPAPTSGFILVLRTYLPKPSVLNGSWQPPALQQVN